MAQIDKAKVFTRRINVRKMKEVILFGQRHNQAIMFLGGAGVGKSQKVWQAGMEMFPQTEGAFSHPSVVEVRLSDKEPADMTGIGIPVETGQKDENGNPIVRTIYATPSFWPTDPNWVGIVFLDELTNASPEAQQVAYQIMLDHKIAEYTFPKGAVFVGAGNRDGDNGATHDLLGPLVNRMTVVEVDYDAGVWIQDYAEPMGVHPSVIAYIKEHPEDIYTGHLVGTAGFEGPCFSSPRQLVKCGNILDDMDDALLSRELAEVLIQGTVGSSLVTALIDFHKRTKHVTPVENVLSGASTEPLKKFGPADVDLVYVLVHNCLRRLRKDVMDTDTYPNDVFVQRVANFIAFMHNNYLESNSDIVVSMVIALLRLNKDPRLPTPLVDLNPGRGPNVLSGVTSKSKELVSIVTTYMQNYAEALKIFK